MYKPTDGPVVLNTFTHMFSSLYIKLYVAAGLCSADFMHTKQ